MITLKGLADAVLYFHALFVAVVLLGAPAQFIFPAYTKVQIGIIGCAGLLQALCKGDCPLTILENFLRKRGDQEGVYAGSCIKHYLQKWGIRVPRGFTTATLVLALLLSIISWWIR